MNTEPLRTCPTCGSEFSGAMEFCPVCILRKALAGGIEAGESSASEDTVKPTTPEQAVERFEHYELVKGQDGKPVELGRGAMGVTYKAYDVDLHCPVTLKVIGERYLGDESARLRFLREARAAASVRHPNVASVFHLARQNRSELLLRDGVCRKGNARESQTLRPTRGKVGAGNRDAGRRRIGCGPQAEAGSPGHQSEQHHGECRGGEHRNSKIIDLGLAKPEPDLPPEAAISTPGAFAGTPEFDSPEQFAGLLSYYKKGKTARWGGSAPS